MSFSLSNIPTVNVTGTRALRFRKRHQFWRGGPQNYWDFVRWSAVPERLRNNVPDGNWVYDSSQLELLSKVLTANQNVTAFD